MLPREKRQKPVAGGALRPLGVLAPVVREEALASPLAGSEQIVARPSRKEATMYIGVGLLGLILLIILLIILL
jgi:hypothetical protein